MPNYSMTRAERWLYFHTLQPVLRVVPWLVWRWPAVCLAALHVVRDPAAAALARDLLPATGRPSGRLARWRFRWQHWYRHEADRLLLLQVPKLTPRRIGGRIKVRGTLPPGGAVLISPHHAFRRIGIVALAGMVPQLGGITGMPARGEDFDSLDVTMRHMFTLGYRFGQQTLRAGLLPAQDFAARRGLRILESGGYLVSAIDAATISEPVATVLGRPLQVITAGTLWLARHSGQPIVPFMVLPQGHGWVLWLGPAVEPTPTAITEAIEACLRLAPASWERYVATAWLNGGR